MHSARRARGRRNGGSPPNRTYIFAAFPAINFPLSVGLQGMKGLFIIRRMLSVLMIAGLALAPLSRPVTAAEPAMATMVGHV